MSASSQKLSKIVVSLSVALIIGGTLAWVTTDQIGQKGINPKKVKEMAKAYEKEICLKHLKTKRACKQHIGRNHRVCMKRSIERPKDRELIYNSQTYNQCMEDRRIKQSKPAR